MVTSYVEAELYVMHHYICPNSAQNGAHAQLQILLNQVED